MIVPLTIALCLTCVLSEGPVKQFYDVNLMNNYFEEFITKYNKSYSNEERAEKFVIFHENVRKINEMNAKSKTAVFGINKFSDLKHEEFMAMFAGLKPVDIPTSDVCVAFSSGGVQAPEEFDWRNQNAVTAVKNQQTCGSCWAFSTTGCVESAYAIKYQQQLDLSEQQLVDCDSSSSGCNGGWPYWALSSIIEQGGQMSESDYPYQSQDGSCSFDASKAQVKLSACNRENIPDEETLKSILVNHGPLSFVLDASTFGSYTGGILDNCENTINHAVLLVGYGTENGNPYWIVKNSWGGDWGEQGFLKIQRGVNACAMMDYGFFGAVVA